LAPAKPKGLEVTKTPSKNAILANRVVKGDVILKVAGTSVNTVEKFNSELEKHSGKQIMVHVNKGGKTGTKPLMKKAGKNREEAKKALANFEEFVKDDTKTKTNVIFLQLVNDFLDWAKSPVAGYSKTWLKDIDRIMLKHNERWGAIPLDCISAANIQLWINERSKDVSVSTVNNDLSPLRKAFQLAVKLWKYIDNDPTKDISFGQPAVSIPKYLSEEEVATLFTTVRSADDFRLNPVISSKGGIRKKTLGQTADELRKNRYNKNGTFDTARIHFLLLTALRKSQFIDLKWEQYDKKRGTITLQTTEEHSEKSYRVNVIPLPKKAKEIIDGQPKNSNYIFPNFIGGKDDQTGKRVGRIFKKFEEETGTHMHLHILRHTALTQLLKHSGNIAAVSKYAGHANIKTTEIYAHILDEQLKEITADFNFTSGSNNNINDGE